MGQIQGKLGQRNVHGTVIFCPIRGQMPNEVITSCYARAPEPCTNADKDHPVPSIPRAAPVPPRDHH